MYTSLELIEKVLKILHQNATSLEEATLNASKETNNKILDELNIIRNYLVEKDLIVHNPRVTYPKQTLDFQNGVEFIGDKIHPDFINDNTTEKYSELIKNNELKEYLRLSI